MWHNFFKTTWLAISGENTAKRRAKFFHIGPVHKSLQWIISTVFIFLKLFSKLLLSRARVFKTTRNKLAFFRPLYNLKHWNQCWDRFCFFHIFIAYPVFTYAHVTGSKSFLVTLAPIVTTVSFCSHIHLTQLTLKEQEGYLLILNYENLHFIPNHTVILQWFCLVICDLFRARHT